MDQFQDFLFEIGGSKLTQLKASPSQGKYLQEERITDKTIFLCHAVHTPNHIFLWSPITFLFSRLPCWRHPSVHQFAEGHAGLATSVWDGLETSTLNFLSTDFIFIFYFKQKHMNYHW